MSGRAPTVVLTLEGRVASQLRAHLEAWVMTTGSGPAQWALAVVTEIDHAVGTCACVAPEPERIATEAARIP